MVDVASDVKRQRDDVVQETSTKQEDQVRATECLGLLQRMGNREHRRKLLQSWLITLSFFSMGLTIGQVGTTLIDLQLITGTNLEGASAFITALTAGDMIGAFISGAVFNKVNTLLLMFISLMGMGVTTIISPYMSSYPLMIFVRVLCGTCEGIIAATGNACQMKMWRNQAKVMMQTMHFAVSLGGVIVPLYTEPFLAKRIMYTESGTSNVTTGNASGVSPTSRFSDTNVYYAFLISGVILLLTSVPLVVLFIKQRSPTIQTNSEKNTNVQITHRKLPCFLHLFMLTNICLMFLFYCCAELTFSSFLMSFLVNEFDSLTTSESLYITTALWASFALSRFIMIFVSKVISSLQLLSLCVLVMLVAYIGFFISVVLKSITAIVVFTSMAGLGLSSIFPAGYSWVETDLLKVTPRVSSSIMITGSGGRIIIPVIMGFLMDQVSNWWFCYTVLGTTVLVCLIFIFLYFLNKLFLNKVYGPIILIETLDIDNEQDQLLIKRQKKDQVIL
ncbi:unnamed protein product [Candidula unifasciata]|uniref:Major facilitator superfamily (MFS) profile domain-containing protein n=1 Tax=Candidula unifasciata TaxID=100452 RepID=A0A8S3Z2W0_9EUPU|nr:unnamed protein product [Candidula unifasciata]